MKVFLFQIGLPILIFSISINLIHGNYLKRKPELFPVENYKRELKNLRVKEVLLDVPKWTNLPEDKISRNESILNKIELIKIEEEDSPYEKVISVGDNEWFVLKHKDTNEKIVLRPESSFQEKSWSIEWMTEGPLVRNNKTGSVYYLIEPDNDRPDKKVHLNIKEEGTKELRIGDVFGEGMWKIKEIDKASKYIVVSSSELERKISLKETMDE